MAIELSSCIAALIRTMRSILMRLICGKTIGSEHFSLLLSDIYDKRLESRTVCECVRGGSCI